MPKSKKTKHSKHTKRTKRTPAPPRVTSFSVCRLAHPFVALSITKAPSMWSEYLVSDSGEAISRVSGSSIKLPIYENEYKIEMGKTGTHAFAHFIMHMHALTSFRLFRFSGANDIFMCTDADEKTVNVALAFTKQFIN